MTFPNELRDIILAYAAEYELLDWIDFEWLSWKKLVYNPNAVDFMIKYPEYPLWGRLSGNPNPAAFYHVRANMPSLLCVDDLASSSCPDAVAYACEHIQDMRDSRQLSRNPRAIPWLREHQSWIDWIVILSNPSPLARDLLSSVGLLDKLPRGADYDNYETTKDRHGKLWDLERDMMYLCENPSEWAMEIVGRNIQHIWTSGELTRNRYAKSIVAMCEGKLNRHGGPILDSPRNNSNEQKSAVEQAKENPEAIHWPTLSADPSAIEFLKDNMDKTTKDFSRNPAIFELMRPVGVFDLL
jgi:hypothetical protein